MNSKTQSTVLVAILMALLAAIGVWVFVSSNDAGAWDCTKYPERSDCHWHNTTTVPETTVPTTVPDTTTTSTTVPETTTSTTTTVPTELGPPVSIDRPDTPIRLAG